MKQILQQVLCVIVISAFAAVITADFWRNPSINPMVLVEIEPKKNSKNQSNPGNDFNEELKEKLMVQVSIPEIYTVIDHVHSYFYLEKFTQPHLTLPELPPELV